MPPISRTSHTTIYVDHVTRLIPSSLNSETERRVHIGDAQNTTSAATATIAASTPASLERFANMLLTEAYAWRVELMEVDVNG